MEKRRIWKESEFKHGTDLEWKSLADEEYRVYVYADGYELKIDFPLKLNVNYKSGGHRVWDDNGVSHYIAPGWRHLYWVVQGGYDHFAF